MRPVLRALTRLGATLAMVLAVASTLLAGGLTTATADDGVSVRRSTVTSSAPYLMPLEDYAAYQPQKACRRTPKPGILALAAWLVARGGGYGAITRECTGTSTSEHKDSRAFDWVLDATSPTDQALATALLDEVLAPDDTGAPNALARRMGIMYIIWNDRMYASYDGFVAKRYLSSSCRTKRRCSPTLRHRDHMHVSLSRQGARGTTSWYAAQPPVPVTPVTPVAPVAPPS